GEVRLDPNDGLHPVLLALCPEVVSAKNVAVVRGRNGRLAEVLRVAEQVIQSRGTVQHRVLSMDMKVNKIAAGHDPDSRPDLRHQSPSARIVRPPTRDPCDNGTHVPCFPTARAQKAGLSQTQSGSQARRS